MRRRWTLLMLAALAAVPALAQIQVLRIPRPAPAPVERVTPVTPPTEVAAPGDAPVFDVANDPERARALINKLRAEKRALREQMALTLNDLQNARTTIDEMTRNGGSLVRAQCVSSTLSRTTSGVEENCAASGYSCGGVEGLCHRQCTSSDQCAGAAGFRCDTAIGRCTLPPIGDD